MSIFESLIQGYFTLIGDIYYELKNDGYYSPLVYEAYVNRPMLEFGATVGFDLDVTLFGVYHLRSKHRLNPLKVELVL